MKNKNLAYILIAIAVAIAGYVILKDKQMSESETTTPSTTTTTATPTTGSTPSADKTMVESATVKLTAQNDSGENGTATLTQQNGKTKVVIELTGAPQNTPQPAHIHVGACPNPGAIKYPLTNVVNG